jgi:hypothetical protein
VFELRNCPEISDDLKETLQAATGERKRELIRALDGSLYYSVSKELFEGMFEDTVFQSLSDPDRSVQDAALDLLERASAKYGDSDRRLNVLVAVAMDRHRSKELRAIAAMYLGYAYSRSKQAVALETLALLANDKTDLGYVRGAALLEFVRRQPDSPKIRAFVDRLRKETDPSIVAGVRFYDELRSE